MPLVRVLDPIVQYELAFPADPPVAIFANSLGTSFHVWDPALAGGYSVEGRAPSLMQTDPSYVAWARPRCLAQGPDVSSAHNGGTRWSTTSRRQPMRS